MFVERAVACLPCSRGAICFGRNRPKGARPMPDTYTQIMIQLVFAVEAKQSLIAPAHQEEVNKYITGIVRNKGSRMLAVNGMPDHLHILIGLHPSKRSQTLCGTLRLIAMN